MSAQWDRKQGIRFYYGNAARDLADSLPREEIEGFEVPHTPAELLQLVEMAEHHLEKIEAAHKEISFLVGDLKRMIR